MEIVKWSGTHLIEIAKSWAKLPEDELRRKATAAANERDVGKLWELVSAYLTLHGGKGGKTSPLTLKSYKCGMKDLVFAWEGQNLIRPSRDAGALYIRELETKLKPSSVEVKLAAARTLYKALRWTKATEANPFENVSAAPDPVPAWEKRKPYSDEDVEKLLSSADEMLRVMVLLGAHAGLRMSEMGSLRWEGVIFARKKLKIVGKGNKPASVDMSERLLAALKMWEAKILEAPHNRTGFVLPYTNDHRRRMFKKHCESCGVDYSEKSVHGLRHSAGTKMYQRTSDLAKTASHLRHENVNTSRIYAHLANDSISKEISDW